MDLSRRAATRRSRNQRRLGVENLEGRALLSSSTIGHAHHAAHRAAHVSAAPVAQPPPPPVPPPTNNPPIVDTGQLPYSIRLQPISIPNAPALQGASYAQLHGKWLFIGGRTNGLHGFDANTQNFPPEYQNRDAIVIEPKTGRVWTRSLDDPGISQAAADALTSTDQQFLQQAKRLYIIGGYGVDSATGQSTTFDTLTQIDVQGLMKAVINGGPIAPRIRQVHDPLFRVTGGGLGAIGKREYLVMGQKYVGNYSPNNAGATQVYTNAIRSFRINSRSLTLGVRDTQTIIDPVNFHRRDFGMSPTILANGQPGLTVYGGVFTPEGLAYREPVTIRGNGRPPIVSSFKQSFNLYNSPEVPIYDARHRTMNTVFLGGISLYTYNPKTGVIAPDPRLPFVDTITTLSRDSRGNYREFVMPNQLPGLLGAEAQFLPSVNAPRYSNGVVKFNAIHRPTVVGTMYGGIEAQQPNNGPTTATAQMFRVILVPERHRR
jgi:hypothetical protein